MSDPVQINLKTARYMLEKGIELPPDTIVVDEEGGKVDLVAVKVAKKINEEHGVTRRDPAPIPHPNHSPAEDRAKRKSAFYKFAFENRRKAVTLFSSVGNQGNSTNNMSGIPDAFEDIFAKVYESELVSRCRRVNMSSPVVRIPELFFSSGIPATATEGGEKTARTVDTSIVKLEARTYASVIPFTNELMDDMAAFESLIPSVAAADIRNLLDGDVISTLLAAPARVHVSGASGASTGRITAADLYNMRAKMWPMNPTNPVILASPAQWTEINLLDREVRPSAEGPYSTFLNIPILIAPRLTAPASGASGSVVMADLSWIYFGVKGDLGEEFNPYYGWDQNISSIRVEGRFDIEAATKRRFDTSYGFTSGHVMSPYVILTNSVTNP